MTGVRGRILDRQPELAKQGFDLRTSTTKLDERFHRIAAAAALQDRLEETPRRLHVVDAVLLKCAESVDAQVTVSRDGQSVPGTSIMGLMMLAAAQGTSILVSAEFLLMVEKVLFGTLTL